ncbi:MAG TPA: DUF4214 domain-containing protein [Ramlibacter sp.]|nr:DUF4214 domain-containing protein [Ramlibacter sp.]
MTSFSAEPASTVTAGTHGRIAALTTGGWVVAWNATGADGNAEVHAQVYDPSGAKAGGEITVFSAAQDAPGTTFNIGEVAQLPDASFVVLASTIWQLEPPHAAPNQIALFGQRVSSAGALVGAPIQVASAVQDHDSFSAGPTFQLRGGGWMTIAEDTNWGIPPFGTSSRLHTFDEAGNPIAVSDPLVGWDPPFAGKFVNGNLLVASENYSPGPWSFSWEVVTPLGQVLSSANVRSTQSFGQTFVKAASVLSNGMGVILWGEATSGDPVLHMQFVDSQGRAQQDITMPPIDGSDFGITSLLGGGFLLTWSRDAGNGNVQVFGQHHDVNGSADGNVVLLDPEVAAYRAYDSYYAGDLPYEVLATPDGGFELLTAAAGGAAVNIQKFDAIPDSSGGGTPGAISVNGGPTAIPSGNFTITGSAGIDTIAMAGAHTDYNVNATSISGTGATDALSGIERINFSDGFAIALDVNGDAGEAYRLYQAAFDRAPDLPGLGYHINDLDHGVPLWLVAQHFIDSPEFQSKYGATTNTQFITLLYENVLHREPEPGGMQYHQDEFARGETRADMLTHFSESPENQAYVIGAIGNGMLYVPLG